MRLDTLLVVAATALTTIATPVTQARHHDSGHVEHERRSVRTAWAKASRLPRSHTLPLRIGLTQRNLDRADEFINDVSNPGSPSYGRHWSEEEVIKTFAPAQESVDEVLAWLEGEGISRDRTTVSRGGNWISLTATRNEAERLLRTEYHIYRHEDGQSHVACDSYHVPRRIAGHVDIIMPTVHFDQRVGGEPGTRVPVPHDKVVDLRRRALAARQLRPGILGSPDDGSLPKKGETVSSNNILSELTQCDTMITPACLRALYSIPPGTLQWPNNTLGVVEYTPQAFLQSDLDLFFADFQPDLVGTPPLVNYVAGGVLQTEKQSYFYNGESSLDLSYAMTLVHPQRVTLYQVGDMEQGGSFNNFLDAVDGSYCTFAGGGSRDPNIDGQYPAHLACGTAGEPARVISTSYAYNEGDLGVRYEARQCAEYMKLGLRGVSLVFASGDFGVAGNAKTCFDPLTGAYQHEYLGGIFNPSFPSTCPYVTSVGATQVMEGSTVRSGEVACEKVIRSGGGFSNVFEMPDYQRRAVGRYFRDFDEGYDLTRYNSSRGVRGYPDVSANGANFVTAVNGEFTLSYGTSASAPVFASILSLINEKRLRAGKSTVGFVNPVLYANPGVLNDIRFGRNPGCGTDGFRAREGWDPVTGLGTPKYKEMEALFMSLP
ncbi:related to serine protease [Cephalotrichum gorgonifer]|uniref:tripeptidyl-peptidase II n=1 Tax=Cephalotrichum gorgonifer TaxID=2041049 RepID=A0AAE8MT93_9PEZI|nr:related to serine protease [Cephalotrichum gorgonifer]